MKLLKFLISIFIFYYLFYDFNLSNLNLEVISFFNLFLTIFILFVGQIILSFRFMSLIDSNFKTSYETIVISNALNILLPARLGEVFKAIYLKKFYNYDYNLSISAIFMERFFDVVMLFLLLLVWGYCYFSNKLIQNSIIFLGIFIFFVVIFFNLGFRLNIEIFDKFYNKINLLFHKTLKLFFFTLILWLFYLMSYWSFFDFLDITQILELFIFSTIALSIPLTPAGVGSFEAIIVFYLDNYGIPKEQALLFATIYHFLILFVDLVMFYFVILNKNLSIDKLKGLK